MKVERSEIREKLREASNNGYSYLVKITAVEMPEHMEVIYFVRDVENSKEETLELQLQPGDLWVPTVIDIFKAADWYEREMAEMFGIEVRGRTTRRLLLEKWDGSEAPLRKSFAWGKG